MPHGSHPISQRNRRVRPRLAAALAVAAGLLAAFPAVAAAFPSTLLPGVAPKQTWVVCQGYNNGGITHNGPRRYSLDLTADLKRGVGRTGCWGDFKTTGKRPVVAPGDGRIAWNNGNGFCVNFDAGDSMMLYHVKGGPRANSRVKAGQSAGRVHVAGKGENGGVAHLHIAPFKGAGCAKSVPFAKGARLGCGAPDMPSDGSFNQWSGTRLSSCEAGAEPRGKLEAASSPSAGKVSVRGWTFDPDMPKKPIRVHVYVGGKNHKSATAKRRRGDVAKAFARAGKPGPRHGFKLSFRTKRRGKQKVCAYAINVPSGPNPKLGCKTVRVKGGSEPDSSSPSEPNSESESEPESEPDAAPAKPKGRFDGVGSPSVGKISVRGWAFDPNVPREPIKVHVYVGGKNHKSLTADGKRDDVAKAYADAEDPGPYHGFKGTFSTSLKGKQEVCVYAINIPSGSNPKLGCKTVTVKVPSPSVKLSKGDSAQGLPGCSSSYCRFMVVNFKNFPSGSHTITCRASGGDEGGFYSYQRSGASNTSAYCYYGFPGRSVWVTVDGVKSNKITW